MNLFKTQYILLLSIVFILFLGPLLGIIASFGIQFPYSLIAVLPALSGYLLPLTALLGAYALYRQTVLYRRVVSGTDRAHFIATSILLLPALYSLITVVVMWSVALVI